MRYRKPGIVDIRITGFYTHLDDLIGNAERDKNAPWDRLLL